jgi:hypothetical protein
MDMSNRATCLLAAILGSIVVGVAFAAHSQSATADNATSDKDCVASPDGQPAQGGHWYYRIERTTNRHCWYFRSDAQGVAQVAPAAANPAAATPNIVLQPSVADARAEMAQDPETPPPNDANVWSTPKLPTIVNNEIVPQGSKIITPSRGFANVNNPAETVPPNVFASIKHRPQPTFARAAAERRAPRSVWMLLSALAGALGLVGITTGLIARFGRGSAFRSPAVRKQKRPIWSMQPIDEASASHERTSAKVKSPKRAVSLKADDFAHQDELSLLENTREVAASMNRIYRGSTSSERDYVSSERDDEATDPPPTYEILYETAFDHSYDQPARFNHDPYPEPAFDRSFDEPASTEHDAYPEATFSRSHDESASSEHDVYPEAAFDRSHDQRDTPGHGADSEIAFDRSRDEPAPSRASPAKTLSDSFYEEVTSAFRARRKAALEAERVLDKPAVAEPVTLETASADFSDDEATPADTAHAPIPMSWIRIARETEEANRRSAEIERLLSRRAARSAY